MSEEYQTSVAAQEASETEQMCDADQTSVAAQTAPETGKRPMRIKPP
jgi:hypothetical protein